MHGQGGMDNLGVLMPDDCGFDYITVDQCRNRGCVWTPQQKKRVPWCRFPNENVARSGLPIGARPASNNGGNK